MTDVFADTYYFLALRNPRDPGHNLAVTATALLGRRKVVTTIWVLTEVADALAAPANRGGFRELTQMLADTDSVVVPAEQSWFDRGIALYHDRPDKAWSLTDCFSFTVMQDRGLREALTGDRHFEQAGFVALLK
jgi:predicted nucleic acid-binding protein